MKTLTFLAFLAIHLAFSDTAQADSNAWTNTIKDNLRTAFDFSSRPIYYEDLDQFASTHAVGIDLHKVVSTSTKDVGTLTAQAYLTRIDNVRSHPGFFDDNDDTQLVYRIFNFNFTGLGENLPNVRVGHMEVAYGLEHTIDTNGTLRQLGQPQNLGIKADWGISINDEHRSFEYEISATSGGNQSLGRQDGSYVFSGRIGTPRHSNFAIGASLYRSLLSGISRERQGLDVQYNIGRSTITSEVSIGENNESDILNGTMEYSFRNRRESLMFYTQLLYFSTDAPEGTVRNTTGTIGVSFTPDPHLDVSAQYSRVLNNPANTNPSSLSLQLRYRL